MSSMLPSVTGNFESFESLAFTIVVHVHNWHIISRLVSYAHMLKSLRSWVIQLHNAVRMLHIALMYLMAISRADIMHTQARKALAGAISLRSESRW